MTSEKASYLTHSSYTIPQSHNSWPLAWAVACPTFCKSRWKHGTLKKNKIPIHSARSGLWTRQDFFNTCHVGNCSQDNFRASLATRDPLQANILLSTHFQGSYNIAMRKRLTQTLGCVWKVRGDGNIRNTYVCHHFKVTNENSILQWAPFVAVSTSSRQAFVADASHRLG